jgi:hypothetical protein
MKALTIVASIVLSVSCASANVFVPKAKLAGETVSARLIADAAIVTAVFQFEEWETKDEKIAYFPIFSTETDPIRVLAKSRFEFRIGDKTGTALPCAAPRSAVQLPSGIRLFWYAIHFDDLIEVTDLNATPHPLAIRVSYLQPLIGGKFFYLPSIAGFTVEKEQRSWPFQLHVRSAERSLRVVSASDYELLGDALTVYLRDGALVVIE